MEFMCPWISRRSPAISGVVVKFIKVMLVMLAFLASPVKSAEIRVLEQNPISENCMLGKYSAWNGMYEVFSPSCDSEEAITLREHAETDSEKYYSDGYPNVTPGDDASGYADDLFFAAAKSAHYGQVIEISGVISAGDAEKLRDLLTDQSLSNCYEPGYCPLNNVISLNSPGGNLKVALEIAEIVRENQFVTFLDEGANCASACSFIFFAGYSEYEGIFQSRRFAHETAQLGVHRPSVPLPDRQFSVEEVNQIVKLIDDVKVQAIRQFLAARVGMPILEQTYATGSNEMYYLSVPQLAHLATVFLEPVGTIEHLDRAGILALCSGPFANANELMPQEILANLEIRSDSFLTHSDQQDFACYGAKNAAGVWEYEFCEDEYCSLLQFSCGEGDLQSDNCDDPIKVDASILIDYYHTSSLGDGLNSVSAKARHLYVRMAMDYSPDKIELPQWVARATVPVGYCGSLDYRAPLIATELQNLLKSQGYDAGVADGILGNKSFDAILDANQSLLGLTSRMPSGELFVALGKTEAQVQDMLLCG